MKRFKFQFETLEKVRKARENESLRALSEAQSRFQAEISEKQKLSDELDRSYSRRESLATDTSAAPSLGVLPLQLEDQFIEGQKQRISRQELAILRAKKRVDQAMRAYLVARRASRMIENLREKAFAAFKIEYRKWEQKQADDTSVMRARLKDKSDEQDDFGRESA